MTERQKCSYASPGQRLLCWIFSFFGVTDDKGTPRQNAMWQEEVYDNTPTLWRSTDIRYCGDHVSARGSLDEMCSHASVRVCVRALACLLAFVDAIASLSFLSPSLAHTPPFLYFKYIWIVCFLMYGPKSSINRYTTRVYRDVYIFLIPVTKFETSIIKKLYINRLRKRYILVEGQVELRKDCSLYLPRIYLDGTYSEAVG